MAFEKDKKRIDNIEDIEKDFYLTGDLDHPRVLFFLMININKARNRRDYMDLIDRYIDNIPEDWEDDKWQEEIIKIEKEAINNIKRKGINISKEEKDEIVFRLFNKKHRAITNLLSRRGKLGEREIGEIA